MNYRKSCRSLLRTLIATVGLLSVAGTASATQGSLSGQTLTSTAFPVGTISVDPKFKYIGTSEFVLYGVADCEIHLFAEVENNQVQRYYWIQFEGYLPEKAHNTYNYRNDPQSTMLGGFAFHERTWFTKVGDPAKKVRPGSDSEAVLKLFEAKGLKVGPDIALIRLVRLDETKRKELMIIYSENLALQGLTAADVAEGGKAFATRAMLVDALRTRAVEGLKMQMK